MISIPYVSMPIPFVRLLCTNMQKSGSSYKNMKSLIWEDPSLRHVSRYCFSEIDSKVPVEKLVQALDWENFRNRMASVYLHYQEFGYFPKKINTDLVEDILTFEKKTKEWRVEGVSRSFLLAFYYKMALLSAKKLNPETKLDNFLITDKVVGLCKYASSRIIKLDWLLLQLFHLEQSIGFEALGAKLAAGIKFEELYDSVAESDKERMMENFISYGASIGEADLFYAESV